MCWKRVKQSCDLGYPVKHHAVPFICILVLLFKFGSFLALLLVLLCAVKSEVLFTAAHVRISLKTFIKTSDKGMGFTWLNGIAGKN